MFEVFAVRGSIKADTGVNIEEAELILKLLENIEPEQSKYPEIGVVCFTKAQRNYITSQLIKIQQGHRSGKEKINQLYRNNLMILSLDELCGHTFQILMVSTVTDQYQWASEQQHLIGAERNDWKAKLTQLVSRAQRKIILCHSLDTASLENISSTQPDTPKGILSSIIRYGEAVRLQNNTFKAEILERFGQQKTAETTATLQHEIAANLQQFLEKGRIHTNMLIEQRNFPIVIKPQHDGEPPLVILIDNYFADSPYTSFEWERQMLNDISDLGLAYAITYSVNWWRDPKSEARRLAGIVLKHDETFSPFKTESTPTAFQLGEETSNTIATTDIILED